MTADALVLGLDLGTGGARALAVALDGTLEARGAAPLASVRDGARHEGDPEAWWAAARAALAACTAALAPARRARVAAVCVDGTSGTLVGLDAAGRCTTPGLMYDDARAVAEAEALRAHDAAVTASWSLAKAQWLARHAPEAFAATRTFVHQADLVAGRLSGTTGVSDASDALKLGYDAARGDFAPWVRALPGLAARLPRVVAPGTALGVLAPEVARALDLAPGVRVVAGCTDGTAAFLASGAAALGDDNTTLGTTLVFKRLADRRVAHPLLYCHALPGGRWLPGAASHVGAGWIGRDFAGEDPARLDAAAAALLPSAHLAWPALAPGERFPLRAARVPMLDEARPAEPLARYAAGLQGVAFVERLGYEVLDAATPALPRGDVYATGGGAASDLWCRLRADVTGRALHRPACGETALGAAVLAALGAGLHPDLATACGALVRPGSTFRPDPGRARAFAPHYARFRAALAAHGLLDDRPA